MARDVIEKQITMLVGYAGTSTADQVAFRHLVERIGLKLDTLYVGVLAQEVIARHCNEMDRERILTPERLANRIMN